GDRGWRRARELLPPERRHHPGAVSGRYRGETLIYAGAGGPEGRGSGAGPGGLEPPEVAGDPHVCCTVCGGHEPWHGASEHLSSHGHSARGPSTGSGELCSTHGHERARDTLARSEEHT